VIATGENKEITPEMLIYYQKVTELEETLASLRSINKSSTQLSRRKK
jgi:hypothetical protein